MSDSRIHVMQQAGSTAPGKTDITKLPPPDGVVRMTPQSGGKYLVEIGRGKYTKRFQLSHAEATQLYSQLPAIVPGLQAAP
jgi:hypothetical protein